MTKRIAIAKSIEHAANLNIINNRDKMTNNIKLNMDYWDCECQVDYIHYKRVLACSICGTCRDEQPNSRCNEVNNYLYGRGVNVRLP